MLVPHQETSASFRQPPERSPYLRIVGGGSKLRLASHELRLLEPRQPRGHIDRSQLTGSGVADAEATKILLETPRR